MSPTPSSVETSVDVPTEAAPRLAYWARNYQLSEGDHALADRSLVDTLAVAAAARGSEELKLAPILERAGRIAMMAHLIDFDDLHIPSTTHISAVCISAAIATGGGPRAYIAGAGVMARIGAMLGWSHYNGGWHATCTAGAPAAAVAAGIALGLDSAGLESAMALAVPAAGGVNRAFGTVAKSLQVGFAVDAGVRAARLVEAGAEADGGALSQWLELVGGRAASQPLEPSIPGGIAIKAFPCCYALQRPIAAVLDLIGDRQLSSADVAKVVVRTPLVALRPLIHSRPTTGLEAKFSLEYGVAAAILDGRPGLQSFTDSSVQRDDAQRLLLCVEVETLPGGEDLVAGSVEIELQLANGSVLQTTLSAPPGSPEKPLSSQDLGAKVRDCAGEDSAAILEVDWADAAALVETWF